MPIYYNAYEKTNKQKDALFNRKYHLEWCSRLQSALAKDSLRKNEQNYLRISEADRRTKMEEYYERQGKAIALIYDKLENTHLRKTRTCKTIDQIIRKVDSEFFMTSKVATL